jgi:hypothetical protein
MNRGVGKDRSKYFDSEKRLELDRVFKDLESHCREFDLIGPLPTIQKIRHALQDPKQQDPERRVKELSALGEELTGRLQDEMKQRLFMSLWLQELVYYNNPCKDWEDVIKRWPKTRIDIEESARCYACSRYAAAIFHALLLAELGVIEVAKVLGVAGDKPGWAALDRLERIRNKPYKDRSTVEQTHYELLDQISPLMLAMKNSWRHKISHVDNRLEWLDTDFSAQLAEEIIMAVRGFMRQLTHELPNNA